MLPSLTRSDILILDATGVCKCRYVPTPLLLSITVVSVWVVSRRIYFLEIMKKAISPSALSPPFKLYFLQINTLHSRYKTEIRCTVEMLIYTSKH